MQDTLKKISVYFLIISLFFTPYFSFKSVSASDVNLQVQVIQIGKPQCSDGIDNDGDGKIDYPADTDCTSLSDNNEGTHQGTGGPGGPGGPSVITQVVFKGKAYPQATVTLLKDAQVAATTKAGPDANFEIDLSGLSSGIYNFSVWAEDIKGRHSNTLSFAISITSGATTVISGIFIPPTIDIDKEEVKRGDILNILGQTAPKAQIAVFINSEEEIVKKTTADESGLWLYRFDSSEVDYGDHSTRSRASQGEDISTFSQVAFFKVGYVTIYKKLKYLPGDVNLDGRVNLIDFSIVAYWWKRPLTAAAKANIDGRINGDGKIDLVDFSVMAYYWTG